MNLQHYQKQVLGYEDPDKLDAALASLPLEKLYAEAEQMVNEGTEWSEEDCLIIALLKWFKSTFKWVNGPPCDKCGKTDMQNPHGVAPTPEERKFGAGNAEVWDCKNCPDGHGRFPRYNDPVKLLETKQGRCGEWSNVMHLILRSLGRTTRYIWNSEDHVWNEIWSEKANRWIHIDSCEAAFDKPLTYSVGWGKKMAYVLGFSIGGARDVSYRYIYPADKQLPRTLVGENELEVMLSTLTADARRDFDPVDLVEWFERDEAENKEFERLREEREGPTKTKKNDEQSEEYLPRQSGSSEWVKSRNEDGSSK